MAEQIYKVNYFTDDERKALIAKGFVLDEDVKFSETTAKDQGLRSVYDELKDNYLGKTCKTENCEKYNKIMQNKPRCTFYADIGKYETGADGFEYFVLPGSTKMYKGTKYFYSTFPKTHFWVGSQRLAMDYAEWYGGGLNVYENKKPIKLFVLNKKNLEKVYAECVDNNAKELLEMIYGINISIEEQTAWICKKNPQWCGKVWLYDEHNSLRPDPKPNRYMPVWGSNLIHDYFYDKYHFDGTFLEYFMSPFREIMDEEISLNIGVGQNGKDLSSNIVMLKDDKDYWETWGLDLPKQEEFLLNETYPPNIGFKINDWYQSTDVNQSIIPVLDEKYKILSYNVHGLVSPNVLIHTDQIFGKLMKLIELADPHVIFLQEFPESFVGKLKELKQYQYIITTNGAEDLRLVALVNLKKCKFNKFDIIKDRKRTQRNSILLHFGTDKKFIKIIGTHLEVGKKYMKNTRFIEYSDFYDTYKKNVRLRIEQLEKLLALSPNIIIGDFNFAPGDPEMNILKKDYKYSGDSPTSIHKKKIDYSFFNPSISGSEKTIAYNESDHLPILFGFDVLDGPKGGMFSNISEKMKGGGIGSDVVISEIDYIFGSRSFAWIIILVLLALVLIFYVIFDHSNDISVNVNQKIKSK